VANKITTILDLDNRGFVKSAKSVRREIADTDGSLNKLKAGAKGAFAGLQQYSGEAALAAGAALVAFGAKSVAAFQDTALSAGQLRDSLGVTAEEASRLQEVAEDLGIGTATLEKSIGIMNRTATNTPSAFAAIGAELVKNADGTTNVNETFLATIDALNKIPDASARAAAAQKVFGRGWQDMSELIMLGADGVSEALASVEDGKVIDDSEIERARKFRDTMDTLRGSIEELQIELGGALVPTVTDAIDTFIEFKDVLSDIGNLIPGPVVSGFKLLGDQVQRSLFWPKYFLDAKDALTETEKTVGTLGDSITGYADTASNVVVPAVEELTAAYDEQVEALRDQIDAIEDAATATMEARDSSLNYRNQVADTTAAIAEATLVQLDSKRSDQEKAQAARDAEAAVYAQADAAVQLAIDLAATTGKTLSATDQDRIYRQELDRLSANLTGPTRTAIDQHTAALDRIPRSILTQITTKYGSLGRSDYTQPGFGSAPRPGGWDGNPATPWPMAAGGIVKARPGGILANIGEAGHDEAVIPLSGPNAKGIGGQTINLTVNAGFGANGKDIGRMIVEELQKYQRRNGPGSLP
jgi:hypothetical protein